MCSSKQKQCNFSLKHPAADVVCSCQIGQRGHFLFLVSPYMPIFALYAHISQTASALPQRLQKPIYQKTIVQPLFSAKFCNSCCKRCNLAKRKLNVAKFTHLVIALIKSLDLFRSKKHKRRSDAKIVCSYFQLNTQCSLRPPSSLPNL